MKRSFKVLISQKEIQKRVAELGKTISKKIKLKKSDSLVVIGILKGSIIFMADLVRKMTLPCEIDFIEAASYGSHTTSSGKVNIFRNIRLPIQGRDVLVVEDIVDTGHTLSSILKHLKKQKPRSLSVCALLYKPSRQVKKVPLDFLGFTIEDHFVVGYGLDFDNKFREIEEVVIYKK